MAKSIRFYRSLAGGERGHLLGAATQMFDGTWRFIPNVASRQRSRKSWPTWEACLPPWVGYPNKCMSDRAAEA